MKLENGILGFLSMTHLSGYDIKKLFDMSAGYFWPADQTQIYRTLKKLVKDGLIEFMEQKKGETVDKKVYSITEKGRTQNLEQIRNNSIDDFISRDAFLMQLFFSGALDKDEQLKFIDIQLENIHALERRLIENYENNIGNFIEITDMNMEDSRTQSAIWAHKWGLIKCREYGKLLEEIKKEL